MSFNKKFFTTGGIVASAPPAAAAFDPLQNFETVTYTGNGSTQKITGYIRKGAAFNGSSSYIESTSLNYSTLPTNAAWSASCWINLGSTSITTTAISLMNPSSPFSGWALFVQSGKVQLAVNGSSPVATTGSFATFSANTWVHVVLTYNGSGTTTLYYNGNFGATVSSTISASTNGNFRIGYAGVWSYFNGKIDQVRIFNTELNPTQVGQLALETYADPKKSTTDYFGDGSGVALYELDDSAVDTGGTSVVFTTWDSTLSPIPNYSENNLRMTGGSINVMGYSKDIITSGKWYWEHEVISIGGESSFGIARPNDLGSHYVVGTSSTSWGLYVNGNLYHNSSITQSGYMSGGFSNGDIIGVEFDLDNGTIEFYKNGVGYGNAFTGLTGEFIVAAESRTSSGINDHRTNFGQFAWDYTPSTGFIGIPSKYNGTATNVNYLGMAFQPDLVWIKSKDATPSHKLFDSVRGINKPLSTNGPDQEYNNSPYGLTSFDSNGFTIADITNGGYAINGAPGQTYTGANADYVAWCFKGGGSAVSNTDGDITSQVSANQDAGFSIVEGSVPSVGYTNTFGHGLSSAPELIIYKCADIISPWYIFSNYGGSLLGNNNVLRFDTSAATSDSLFDITSTTFKTGASSSAHDFIAYCFHSIDGYQKIGSYSGSYPSSTTVTTGFQPRFVMLKRTNTTGNWNIWDAIRNPSADDANNNILYPNKSDAETDAGSGRYISFDSDGFTISGDSGDQNANGSTYIYLAIA